MTDLECFLDCLKSLGFKGVVREAHDPIKLAPRVFGKEKHRDKSLEVLVGQTPRGGDSKSVMCWHFDKDGKLIDYGNWET